MLPACRQIFRQTTKWTTRRTTIRTTRQLDGQIDGQLVEQLYEQLDRSSRRQVDRIIFNYNFGTTFDNLHADRYLDKQPVGQLDEHLHGHLYGDLERQVNGQRWRVAPLWRVDDILTALYLLLKSMFEDGFIHASDATGLSSWQRWLYPTGIEHTDNNAVIRQVMGVDDCWSRNDLRNICCDDIVDNRLSNTVLAHWNAVSSSAD